MASASINKLLENILSTLNTQFGRVANDAKIPKQIIEKYVYNTRQYALQQKTLADTATYIVKCSKINSVDNLLNNSKHSTGSRKHVNINTSNLTKKNKDSDLIEQFKGLITEAFDVKNNKTLVNILRNSRFVIYLSQYKMLIKSGKKNIAKNLIKFEITENDSMQDELYFKITEIYFIAYLTASFAIHANLQLQLNLNTSILDYMTNDIILSTNEIDKIMATRDVFSKTPVSEIKRTILSYHGEQTSNLFKLPPNKVLVILTPVNWYIYSKISDYIFKILKTLNSDEHIKRFINNYMCYINTITSGGTDESQDCLLNGMQVYYGGQYYFDIELGATNNDLDSVGKFDTYTYDQTTDTLKAHNKKILDTSIYEEIIDDNKPEIIFIKSCRVAESKYVNNLLVELIYRYAKIHDVIADAVSLCPESDIEKAKIKVDSSVPYCSKSDYTDYFTQRSRIKTHNDPKYEKLLLNGNLSGIRHKKNLKIGQMVDYIIKKTIDDKTTEYIQTLYNTNKQKLYVILYNIRVDFESKFIKIFEVLNSQPFLGIAGINSIIIILNMLYVYLSKTIETEETIPSTSINKLFNLLKKSNPVSDALITNLPILNAFEDITVKTRIQNSISIICKQIHDNYRGMDDDISQKIKYILGIFSPYCKVPITLTP